MQILSDGLTKELTGRSTGHSEEGSFGRTTTTGHGAFSTECSPHRSQHRAGEPASTPMPDNEQVGPLGLLDQHLGRRSLQRLHADGHPVRALPLTTSATRREPPRPRVSRSALRSRRWAGR